MFGENRIFSADCRYKAFKTSKGKVKKKTERKLGFVNKG